MTRKTCPESDVGGWLEKAEYDIGTAEVNLDNSRFDVVAFYSHQAAEKALKAIYIMKYKRLWKIHDLVELAKKVKAPQNILELCDALNPHYIETRYLIDVNYDKDMSKEALDNARKVVLWAKKIMKKL